MNVVLIHPRRFFYKSSDIIIPQTLGILYVASSLREAGHSVTIIDAVFKGRETVIKENELLTVGLRDESICSHISKDTDIIGITVCNTFYAQEVHRLCESIKRCFPATPLVMGGVYPSTLPHYALNSKCDFLIKGEGEKAFPELLSYIQHEGALPQGVIKKGNLLSKNSSSVKITDLDSLPFPARDLIPFDQYMTVSPMIPGYRSATVLTTRGCPYQCTFCPIHATGGYSLRKRSPDNVLLEIEQLIENYHVNHIDFLDDNFTMDPNHAMEIMDGIIRLREKHSLVWSCDNGVRVDSLDRGLLDKMEQSGCINIGFAIEHGSQEMLRLMNKDYSLDLAIKNVKLAKEFNIPLDIHVICGYPGETENLFQESLEFLKAIKKLNPKNHFKIMMAQPYPETELFSMCQRQKIIPKDLNINLEGQKFLSADYTYEITTPDLNYKIVQQRIRTLRKNLQPADHYKFMLKRFLPASPLRLIKQAYQRFQANSIDPNR